MYPQTNDDLTDQVWAVMQYHRGYMHRIDRERLTSMVLGKVTDSNDRKVRDALSELPVVWNDGYFVPTSQREAEEYRAAMQSRIKSISKRLRVLDDYLRSQNEPVRVEQMNWIQS